MEPLPAARLQEVVREVRTHGLAIVDDVIPPAVLVSSLCWSHHHLRILHPSPRDSLTHSLVTYSHDARGGPRRRGSRP